MEPANPAEVIVTFAAFPLNARALHSTVETPVKRLEPLSQTCFSPVAKKLVGIELETSLTVPEYMIFSVLALNSKSPLTASPITGLGIVSPFV